MSRSQGGKVFSSKDAKQLKAVEAALNTHIASAQKALGNLTKAAKNTQKLRVRHYGRRCPG